jgi:hypothetical protein
VRFDQIPLRAPACLPAILALTCALAGAVRADRLPLIGSGATAQLRAGNVSILNHLIVPVDPDSVPCSQSATFNSLAGGENPGTNYDGIVLSGGLRFAERFVGQTLGYSGDFDVVTGIPTNPLTLQVGAPGQNLDVFTYTSNVLAGLGNVGFKDLDAIGEGSISVYLPNAQSRVSFEIVGGNGGSATLGFYRADGSLIDNVVLSGLGDFRYGFATPDGVRIIAGILIQSTDASGIGIDNVCHDGALTSSRVETWGRIKSLYR